METALPESIQVSIFHQTYNLRSRGGGEHVRRIARLVDERMRMVASQLATHDVGKVAVLAALNIADEMELLREQYDKDLRALLPQPADDAAEGIGAADAVEATGGEVNRQRSWFDDIFGSDETVKSESERLSSRVTAKLQMHRRAERESLTIETDEDEN